VIIRQLGDPAAFYLHTARGSLDRSLRNIEIFLEAPDRSPATTAPVEILKIAEDIQLSFCAQLIRAHTVSRCPRFPRGL
jgi:hypothetical protein